MIESLLEGNIARSAGHVVYSLLFCFIILVFYLPLYLIKIKILLLALPLIINFLAFTVAVLILQNSILKKNIYLHMLVLIFTIVPNNLYFYFLHPNYLTWLALSFMFYCLLKDNFRYSKMFYYSLFFLGISAALKISTIMYMLIPGVFLFYSLYIKRCSLKMFCKKMSKCLLNLSKFAKIWKY